jgi:hypothetical protein
VVNRSDMVNWPEEQLRKALKQPSDVLHVTL